MDNPDSRERALILVSNDDGVQSTGLWAVVEALLPLGEVLVVAPDHQWSGGGRSMPPDVTGRYERDTVDVDGRPVTAYAVDASPALAIVHGVVEFAPRPPDLVVSGINYGANLGTEVTISGTVGAALEGGAFGIPAIAVSLEGDDSTGAFFSKYLPVTPATSGEDARYSDVSAPFFGLRKNGFINL